MTGPATRGIAEYWANSSPAYTLGGSYDPDQKAASKDRLKM
jgi:hypothetical protein